MTDRADLEALMEGPMQAGPSMTDEYCPECGKQSVVALGAFRRCVTLGCGWAVAVTRALAAGDAESQREKDDE
ncbi:UNVERIFIED_CONTAM: hypothetical protein BEN50_22285 [Euhalothece sp. KZN 001]